MSGLIDTHAHLDGFQQRGELTSVLQRADEAGVSRIIAIGTDPGDWEINRNLAETYSGSVFRSAGLHPCHVDATWEAALSALPGFLEKNAHLVALGEAGLDYFRLSKENRETLVAWQHQAFREQIRLARSFDLPLIVHSRSAFEDTIRLLREEKFPMERAVFHCFAEGPEEVAELNRLGGRASFTAIATFPKADAVRAALRKQPLDLLMIETDCPYLAPQAVRGQTNEPAYVRLTAQWMAGFLGMPEEELEERTTANAKAFFSLPD